MPRSGLADELHELEASLLADLSPRNVMRVADACRLAGNPARALELLEALVADRPTAIAPLVLMAWCLGDLGRNEESRARLEELRAIDPANPWAAGRAPPDLPASETPAEPAAAEPAKESPAEPLIGESAEELPVEPVIGESAEESPVELIAGEPLSREDPGGVEFGEAEEETLEESTGSDVFEIPAESDLAAAVAELSEVLPAQGNEPQDEPLPELQVEPEREQVEPEPEPVEPEPEPVEPEPEPGPVELVAAHLDEEAEAEPERALTAEQMADIPPSPLYSATLAEIFERQGFEEKAMEIYAEVVRAHPERVDLRERIAELERRFPGEPGR